MPRVIITRKKFLQDKQGRTFADVLDDKNQPFDSVLDFLNNDDRQRRMEEAELHHDRPPLAGVVRELEAQPDINQFLSEVDPARAQRLRQAIGVVVRMIMDLRGWKKSGKKGSLGVRAQKSNGVTPRNSGGLSLWFVRAERYQPAAGNPFRSVAERCNELDAKGTKKSSTAKRPAVPT